MSARRLWVLLHMLPLDSPLAFATAGEMDAAAGEDEPVLNERGRLPAPKALYDIPVAKSFAEVGSFMYGQDLN